MPLDEPVDIVGIITQGDPENDDNYADTYQVKYTLDNETWLFITDPEGNPVVRTHILFLH